MVGVIDMNEMQVFVRVVEHGGLSRAASELGLQKSTVSRRIASLEDRLGVRLLERTTRSVRTTEVGQAYYDRCARLVAEAEEAEEAVRESQGEPGGTLRISVPSTGIEAFAPVMFDFVERYPRVSLEVVAADHYVDLIRDGYDLALRAGQLGDSSLVARKLGENRMLLVAAPSYLDANGEPKSAADLRHHECITQVHAGQVAHWTIGEGKSVQVSGRVRLSSAGLTLAAALRGLGLAMLPDVFVKTHIEAGRLRRILPDLSTPSAGLYVVYPSRSHLSTKVRAFVDHVLANPRIIPGAGSRVG